MTEQLKEQMLMLREQGKGYKAIAKELNMSVGSVSTFFRRLAERNTATFCLYCKHKMHQTRGHRQKKFCSEECRRLYWKQNRASGQLKAFYSQTCTECGTQFTIYGNPNRKYCCWACYQKARLKGKEEGQ